MKATIERIATSAYQIPTETPEADGTLEWNQTTLVVVHVSSQGVSGLGYTFADTSTARLITDTLSESVVGKSPFDIPAVHATLVRSIRNLGRPGIAAMAISAIDMALWDLKARMLNVSVLHLWGAARQKVLAYASGGFTTYSLGRLQEQFSQRKKQGFLAAKMKVGANPLNDIDRVKAARMVLGENVHLFVDANGAYNRKQALVFAQQFSEFGVTWFEEPVSSDDLEGLSWLREHTQLHITAGEYGYDLPYFRRMLMAQAVDVLQIDATRCGGPSVFLKAAALCESFSLPVSAHTAPSLHAYLCCSATTAVNVEYFFDHARIESMFFRGAVEVEDGYLKPDPSRPGFGLEFQEQEARQFAA